MGVPFTTQSHVAIGFSTLQIRDVVAMGTVALEIRGSASGPQLNGDTLLPRQVRCRPGVGVPPAEAAGRRDQPHKTDGPLATAVAVAIAAVLGAIQAATAVGHHPGTHGDAFTRSAPHIS